MSLLNFSAFALTRSEMKNVVGAEKCMPAHYDVWVHNGQGSSKNNGNQQVFCATSKDSAWRMAHKTKQYGNYAMSVTYNAGTC